MTRYLIDSNLLVLLILGGSDRALIGAHRRLKNFEQADFVELERLLGGATSLVTLPYILAESSNLIGIGKSASIKAVSLFEKFVRNVVEFEVQSDKIVEHRYFRKFGLTDTAIIHLLRDNVHVLTVDHALYGVLVDLGIKSINMRHRTKLQ